MTSVKIDTSEVQVLAVDLRGTGARLAAKLPPVVAELAKELESQLRSDMQASAHFSGVARAITSDQTHAGFGAEVGPRKGKPGSLANIAYWAPSVSVYRGGPRWSLEAGRGPGAGGGTVREPQQVLAASADRITRRLRDAAIGEVLP